MPKFGVPTDEQLAKINKLAPKTFSTEEVFVFSGKSAGDMIIENRYIQLSKELLETFVKNSKEGVSWLLNHSWSSWSEPVTIFGRTYDGRIEASGAKGETVAMFLDKYIPRSDTPKNGRSANSVVEDIENGVLFDTSIGWGSSKMVCSVCNMDYYGGNCSHYRGQTYEDADGNKKLCYIIAKNPGYLMEESGVFDGAYTGAGILWAKDGDEFETPQGKFMIVEELKNLPKGTNIFGAYSEKGGIVTFVKKSEHKKIHVGGLVSADNLASISTDDILPPNVTQQLENTVKILTLKGGVKPMNEKLTKLLETLGITYKEDEAKPEEILNQFAEKWEAHIQTIQDSATPIVFFMTAEHAKEKLGKEVTTDEALSLMKEGQDYLKKITDEALAMGVRAMGNDFKKETWEKTFTTMSSKDILDITATWEAQAKAEIPAGRKSDAGAGQKQVNNAPDEAYKVGK